MFTIKETGSVETPAIRRHANRNFERADAMHQSMLELKEEIKTAKVAQRAQRARSMRVLVESAINQQTVDAAHVSREINETRRLEMETRSREQRAWSLESKMRSAMEKAHVLINLARRASSGRIYAKHQAEIFIQK